MNNESPSVQFLHENCSLVELLCVSCWSVEILRCNNGLYTSCKPSLIFSVHIFHCYPYLTGKLIYEWLLSHCTQCKTKYEYNHSQRKLSQFLSLEETGKVLNFSCVQRISSLQAALLTKEYKLASYLRMEIRDCMDA